MFSNQIRLESSSGYIWNSDAILWSKNHATLRSTKFWQSISLIVIFTLLKFWWDKKLGVILDYFDHSWYLSISHKLIKKNQFCNFPQNVPLCGLLSQVFSLCLCSGYIPPTLKPWREAREIHHRVPAKKPASYRELPEGNSIKATKLLLIIYQHDYGFWYYQHD